MSSKLLLQSGLLLVLSGIPPALAVEPAAGTNGTTPFAVSPGGTSVVAIGTGSSGTTDTSVADRKAGYAFRFYYCDNRPWMNPTEATIKAYTASGNGVCLFYEGGGYEPGTPRSERSANQCRCRALTGGYEGGRHDAAIAYAQAAAMGMPAGRPIFFTVDTDPGPAGSARMKKVIDYVRGAADWAHGAGYTVGCYGSSYLLKALYDQKIIDFGEETTAWCHNFHEVRSQIRQQGPGPYAAYAEDYGQWRWHEAPTASIHAARAEQTTQLDTYWPLHAPVRTWHLVDRSDCATRRMTVTHTPLDDARFRLWFSGKPGQKPGGFDIEQFRYCENAGGDPWLWLDQYIDYDRESGSWVEHSVQSTRILFTPEDEPAQDLIADGTYARCGGEGQPYLFFRQTLRRYRLQVWGTIDRDRYPRSNWQWYWDATVSAAAEIANDCMPTSKVVRAIKVQEAWWSNFPGEGGWTGGKGGPLDTNGVPTGDSVIPFRTVWHAEGQLPYYMTGTAAEAPAWCTREIEDTAGPPLSDCADPARVLR